MKLITKVDDERLKFVDDNRYSSRSLCAMYRDSLRAVLESEIGPPLCPSCDASSARIAELEQQVRTLDEYVTKGVAFRDELQARIKELEGADAMVRAIEEQFPDWKNYRDLSECVRSTLEWVRAKAVTAWDQGFREGESKQAILEIRGRDKFMEDMKLRQEDIAELRREIARLKALEGGGK